MRYGLIIPEPLRALAWEVRLVPVPAHRGKPADHPLVNRDGIQREALPDLKLLKGIRNLSERKAQGPF